MNNLKDNIESGQQDIGAMPDTPLGVDAIQLPTAPRVSYDHHLLQANPAKGQQQFDITSEADGQTTTTAYGAKVLWAEVEQLAHAPAGTRNDALNRSSFAVAQLVAAGEINGDEADASLRDACVRNGLTADDGLRSVEKTINSAFQAAKEKPRTALPSSPRKQVYRDIASASTDWEEDPVAFNDQEAPVPDYRGAPGVFVSFIEALSEQTQARPEFAIAGVLGAVAAALQGKFVVQAPSGYTEHTNLYVICVGESGERKSPTCQECSAPLVAYETYLQNEARPLQIDATNRREALKKAKKKISQKAARTSDNAKQAELLAQMASFDEKMPEDIPTPQLLLDDTTPEAMAQVLAANGEQGVIFEAEGGFLENLAGRYSIGAPNLDLVLKGYNGERVRINRKGQEPTILNRPLLTIVLLPQPYAISDGGARRAFRQRGIDARFIYFVPPSRLGFRNVRASGMKNDVRMAYHQKIRGLLDINVECDDEGRPIPYVLRLSPEASQCFIEFDEFIEKRLLFGGEFEGIRDWCAKTPGRILRIAAAFHALEHGLPQEHDISDGTMDLAIRFGKSLITHAKIAYEVMGQDPSIELAKRVLPWIVRKGHTSFTLREAQQVFKTQVTNVSKVRDAMEVLVERGYLREVETHGPKGGRPSTVFVVNPKTF